MLHVNTSQRAALPPSMLPMTRAAASVPASADAELIALGRRLKPLFDRWRRQTASAGPNVSIAVRERLYRQHDRLHAEADELIDEILACRASTLAGLAVQIRATMIDTHLDTLFFDPDTRIRGFVASLCAVAGVAFPITD